MQVAAACFSLGEPTVCHMQNCITVHNFFSMHMYPDAAPVREIIKALQSTQLVSWKRDKGGLVPVMTVEKYPQLIHVNK